MPVWYFDLVVGLAGLFFGSFFNVCIWRIPRHKSIVNPPSHCPKCRTPIRFYDNIPVLSYLVLRGRCRKCRQPIAVRYPVVELLTALLFLALAIRFGMTWQFLRGVLLVSLLIIIAFIDLDTRKIPDALSLPGIAAGLLSSLLIPGRLVPALRGLASSAAGAAAGALVIYVVRWLWRTIFRKEGMGAGDVTLAALIGSFLGGQRMLLTILLGALAGVVVGGIAALVARRKVFGRQIPFGPYFAIGALVALFAGDAILRWYWQLFRH